jgi:hypothetical protein
MLSDLKLMMLQYPFLTQDEPSMPRDLRLLFREVLEFVAIASIKTENVKEFVRVMRQIKSIYYRREDPLEKSEQMPLMISAWLLYLLTQAEVTEFSIEFALAKRFIGDHPFLVYADKLLQAISENSFARIYELQAKSPSPLFSFFLKNLLDGARNNHADSLQDAYESLKVTDLAKILHFSKLEDARDFIDKRGWKLSENEETILLQAKEERSRVVDKAARYVDLAVAISQLQ